MSFSNLKIIFALRVRGKSFFTFKYKLPKIFLSDLFTSITVVAAMLPITVRRDRILKSEFVRVWPFRISLVKRWRLTKISSQRSKNTSYVETMLKSFGDFSILSKENDHFKLNIMESLLIVRQKPVLDKADSLLSLKPFWYYISGLSYDVLSYHMMPIYHIVRIKLPFVQF